MLSRSNLTGASWDEVWASSEATLAPTADRRAPGHGKKKGSKKHSDKVKVSSSSLSSCGPKPHDSFSCTIEDPPDPLCDLYFRGFSSSFDDIMDVYQKDDQYRQSHRPPYHHSNNDNEGSVSTDESEVHHVTSSSAPSSSLSSSLDHATKSSSNYNHQKEGWTEHNEISITKRNTQLLNIGAYLISGVLLIFILECFIKMGMAIAISNRPMYS